MRTFNELQQGCADLLKKLRLRHNLSKFKIANMVGVSDHTWGRYESAESAPTVPEFIYIYEQVQEDAMRDVLDYLYPDIYKGLTADSSMEELRQACSHFVQNVCSDDAVRKWNFLAFGEHGSSTKAQLEMFTMIDHLPMKYRYMIAECVLKYWELAESHHELVSTDHIMPNLEIFKEGLTKGKQATFDGKNSYSSITKGD